MADPQPAALGPDDYQMLLGMLTSEQAETRTQGQGLAKKLTPEEHQAFFDYQQQANRGKGELTRTDATLGGLPPEAAVVSGLGIGRAVAGAGLSAAERIAAGTKAAVGQVAPVVKYEVARHALQAIGVPSGLAMAGALAVSGYRGGKAAPAEAATTATETAGTATRPTVAKVLSDVELARQEVAAGRLPQKVLDAVERAQTPKAALAPVTAAPVVQQPVPAAAPAPSAASAALPDQRALNEAAIAVRRAAVAARPPIAPEIPEAWKPLQSVSPEMQPVMQGATKSIATLEKELNEAVKAAKDKPLTANERMVVLSLMSRGKHSAADALSMLRQ